jgi:hypothetical protein
MSPRVARGNAQRGAALMIIAALLAIGICAFLVSALNASVFDHTTTVRKRNAEALQEAKAALLGHVVREVLNFTNSVPGMLPCPESPSQAGTSGEGAAAASCDPAAADKTVGRLPWRTLGIDKLVDGSNEPLWYAVAPNWVQGAALPVINSGSAGPLSADGTVGVVAVIIAPGRPINLAPSANQIAAGCQARQQSRNDRSHVAGAVTDPDYRDYLECQNASSPIDLVFGSSVVENDTNVTLNDQLVYVTAAEVLNAIQGPIAERMQRTVVPLFKEYSELWPGGGSFMPYAVAFATPESGLPLAQHCGPSANPAQQREGILPLAPNAAPCASTWNGFNVSGSVSPSAPACTTLVSTNVRCSFTYYTFTALGNLLLGLLGGTTRTTEVTIQAMAPHAAASFRTPLRPSDVTFPGAPAGVTASAATLNPQTDGDAQLDLKVRVTATDVCDDLLIGLTCNLLPGLLVNPINVTVEFPQLAATTTLQGTRLSAAALAAHPPPFNLHTPAATAPHYWFMQNQWYRYTYYAVSLTGSAAGAGGNFTVNGFPAANGNANDKRFVLAVMGPATTGQVRGPAAALNQYIEGDNAATAAAPRVFAFQVHAVSGNDRIATCPFNDGAASACN